MPIESGTISLAKARDLAAQLCSVTAGVGVVLITQVDGECEPVVHPGNEPASREMLQLARIASEQYRNGAVSPSQGVYFQRVGGIENFDILFAASTQQVDAATFARVLGSCVTLTQAHQMSSVLNDEINSLAEQLSNTYEELSLIYQLSSGMTIGRQPEEFFRNAMRDVIEVTGARGMVSILRNHDQTLQVLSTGDVPLSKEQLSRLGAVMFQSLNQQGRVMLVNDVESDPVWRKLAPGISRMLAAPLKRTSELHGAIVSFDKLDDSFNTQDIKLISAIAIEVSIYLENHKLFADAQDLLMGLLHSLTSAVDAKDAYTCGHSRRVALMGRELSLQAGFTGQFAERVYMAGLLHDVGKIGIPEEVLRKAGKLTDEEFDTIKTHVVIGTKILRDVRQVQDLIPGVLYHHERYDGRGYPERLAGQDIPLMGRVLCIADCFDAMTSNRTYRKALPLEVALMEIRRCAGTQFDPVLAEAFLAIGVDRLRELTESVTDNSTLQLMAA